MSHKLVSGPRKESGHVAMGEETVFEVIGMMLAEVRNEVRKEGERRVNVASHGWRDVGGKWASLSRLVRPSAGTYEDEPGVWV